MNDKIREMLKLSFLAALSQPLVHVYLHLLVRSLINHHQTILSVYLPLIFPDFQEMNNVISRKFRAAYTWQIGVE